ncbi:mesenteric estrogen-dependent adipogenesis protein-like [Rhinoraja longicauda]
MSVDRAASSSTGSEAPRAPATDPDPEMALLPIELLLSLHKSHFCLTGRTLEIRGGAGSGYNVISDGPVGVDGRMCNVVNCIQSTVTLTSRKEYKDFQTMILSKLMVFFTSVEVTEGSTKFYAVIVNTHHPRMRQEIEDSLKNVTASEVSGKYVLQFSLQNAVRSCFSLRDVQERGLVFTCVYLCDPSNVSHVCTTKTKELNGRMLNLSPVTEDEKCKVKKLLDKMSEPTVQMTTGPVQSPAVVSSYQAGSLEDKVSSSTQPDAKRLSVKDRSSSQLTTVNEKSHLLQFTQHLPKYIE